jgi:hypothetical protein
MGECGKAVLDRQCFSDQDRDRGEYTNYPSRPGLVGPCALGYPFLAWVLALSEEVIGLSPTKTDHYQIDFPSGTLVFRSCLTPSGHSRSCAGNRKSNPRKNAEGKEVSHKKGYAQSYWRCPPNWYSKFLQLYLVGAVDFSGGYTFCRVRCAADRHMSVKPARVLPNRRELRDPPSSSRFSYPLPSCPLECLNSNTYGVPMADKLSPSHDTYVCAADHFRKV